MMTSLDMHGFSVSLLPLDDQLLAARFGSTPLRRRGQDTTGF